MFEEEMDETEGGRKKKRGRECGELESRREKKWKEEEGSE